MEANEYYDHVKYCPECGKRLERDPIAGVNACFLHGEFVITNDRIVWRYTVNLIKRT